MAKKDRGWIKLHRSIHDSNIWNLDEPFDRRSAWIDLLLMVNHEDRAIFINGHRKIIGVGQRWTSVRTLAERWKWSKDRVMRYLDMLERDSMIRLDKTPDGTLLTLINYGFFQYGRDTDKDTNKDTGKDADKDAGKDETRTNRRTNNKNERRISGEAASDSLSGRVME